MSQQQQSESSSRALAYVERIRGLEPIKGADRIEVARVRGWRVVVRRGQYSVGDLVVYCEIDSVLPPWKHFVDDKLDRSAFRIRTVSLRGVVSQGYVVPLRAIAECHPDREHLTVDAAGARIAFDDGRADIALAPGADLTEFMGVAKYEPPLHVTECSAAGLVAFPEWLPKSDQLRVQNIPDIVTQRAGVRFEVTEKLDGASISVYYDDASADVCVCTRNCRVAAGTADRGAAVLALERAGVVEALRRTRLRAALQGELVGPGVQGNPYGLAQCEWRMFDAYLVDERRFATPSERRGVVERLGLSFEAVHVPVLATGALLPQSADKLLADADGKAVLNPSVLREGVVWKSEEPVDGDIFHFKAVSNSYLLRQK
eukprot:m51a1_g13864 hypothetical protein (373) ;mRNA; f:607833-608951